jgi:hypothetical protein
LSLSPLTFFTSQLRKQRPLLYISTYIGESWVSQACWRVAQKIEKDKKPKKKIVNLEK